MPSKKSDPIDTICEMARSFSDVDEGVSCSQASFKTHKKAFLFAGMQGGRCKLMFKLDKSLDEATGLETEHPEDFQVGANNWVTVRFTKEKPLPAKFWKKWLKESYQLSSTTAPRKKAKSK